MWRFAVAVMAARLTSTVRSKTKMFEKNQFASAKAAGRGDWKKVIELEEESLSHDPKGKEFHYAMIGYAYQNLGETKLAKQQFSKALKYDSCCQMALEGLAEIYAKEKDYDLAYQYVLKGLYQVKEIDFEVSSITKTIISILIKMFRPSRPYREIRAETETMDQSRNKWKDWAEKYKAWYEDNISNQSTPNVH